MALTADVSLSTCCKTLQHQLTALNAPDTYNVLRNFGMLNALESQRNMAGVDPGLKTQLENQWGKGAIDDGDATCTFKLWVEKPECGTATSGVGSLCANSNTNAPTDNRIQIDVKIEEGFYKEGRIRPQDFNCLCAGTQAEVISREITYAAKQILNSVELALVTDVQAAMGDYIDGVASLVTPRTLNLFNSSATNFTVQPIGWQPLLNEYAQMQVLGGVIGVGGNAIHAYNTASGLIQDAIATNGFSLPGGIDTWYDPNVQALADETFVNPFLTWAPGALWIMRYLDNVRVNEYHIKDANVERTVLNIFGHLFDFSIHYDGTCDTARWVLNYQYDLFNLPQSVFGTCLDTNQKQAYDIGCDVFSCGDWTPAPVIA